MPRFIRKPRSQHVIEGNTAEFSCTVLAVSTPIVSWFRGNEEIKQSTKYMKKYNNNSYLLEIKRSIIEDKGEYIVKAVNSYGEREYNAFLHVDRKYTRFLIIIFLLSFK